MRVLLANDGLLSCDTDGGDDGMMVAIARLRVVRIAESQPTVNDYEQAGALSNYHIVAGRGRASQQDSFTRVIFAIKFVHLLVRYLTGGT